MREYCLGSGDVRLENDDIHTLPANTNTKSQV